MTNISDIIFKSKQCWYFLFKIISVVSNDRPLPLFPGDATISERVRALARFFI